jgi:hypothetical protein
MTYRIKHVFNYSFLLSLYRWANPKKEYKGGGGKLKRAESFSSPAHKEEPPRAETNYSLCLNHRFCSSF